MQTMTPHTQNDADRVSDSTSKRGAFVRPKLERHKRLHAVTGFSFVDKLGDK